MGVVSRDKPQVEEREIVDNNNIHEEDSSGKYVLDGVLNDHVPSSDTCPLILRI